MQQQKYNSARKILGENFASPEEIARVRNITYTEDQLVWFIDTLPNQDTLLWCRDRGYLCIAGPNQPMSFREVCKLSSEFLKSVTGEWYKGGPFAEEDKVYTAWLMLGMQPFPGSMGKCLTEQRALLIPEGAIIPNVAEVAWEVTTYKAVRNKCLFSQIYVRTASQDSPHSNIAVGSVDGKYLYYNRFDEGSPSPDIGIAYMKER